MNDHRPTPRHEPSEAGVVARLSSGGWGPYHRHDCVEAPHRGDPGVRDVIHGPWRYLAAHWRPCARCRPPAAVEQAAA
jgi:hypothetical protein